MAWMGEERNMYKVLVGKAKGKRPLGRTRCRRVDGIKMMLERLAGRLWSGLTGSGLGLVAGSCEHGDEHLGSDTAELVNTQSPCMYMYKIDIFKILGYTRIYLLRSFTCSLSVTAGLIRYRYFKH
jgi:hypothetical protein